MKKSKKQKITMIVFFLILIFGFSAVTLVMPKRDFSERENRTLAKLPGLSSSSFFDGSFSKDYESYLTDQFPFRDTWIGMKTQIERSIGKQESNDIYFAEDDYLIEKHSKSFTSPQAETNILLLKDFIQSCVDTYGSEHVTAMVVPNAVDVLKNYLPAYASPYDEEEYLSKIVAVLPENTWFDTSSVLNGDSTYERYYRTDHHWTTEAAYRVYAAWAENQGFEVPAESDYDIKSVTNDFKGTIDAKVGGENRSDSILTYTLQNQEPYTVSNPQTGETSDSVYHEEALQTRDKYGVFFGGNHAVTEIKVQNKSAKKLLVIKDSYANCFLPFTLKDFSEVDFIDIRYYNESLKAYMEKNSYTDVLFLYNASGFAEDTSLMKLRN